MKKLLLISLVTFCFTNFSQAQFTFSVNPGVQLNSAQFGYKVGKFVPFLSFQYMGVNGSWISKGKQTDWNSGNIVDYQYEQSLKLGMVLPTLGAKYFFLEKDKLKAYANLSITKPIIIAEYRDSQDPTIGFEVDDFKDKFKLIGGQVGFGMEYFFDDHFSLGGEFGLMMINAKAVYEDDAILQDLNTGNFIQVTNTETFTLRTSPTYSKISLNFYF